MTTPIADRSEPQPLSGTAVFAGVLSALGAFALLISLVAAFANGAHTNQVLSAATWKQLGTGGGIVTGLTLLVAWAIGGYLAARFVGRDGLRHGVWVFVVGVVLVTVVCAAVTWLPDTSPILRNLRLLGIPVRRSEWRDFFTVAGIASIAGMAAGAVLGGWYADRKALVPAAAPAAPAPVTGPEPEPLFVGDTVAEPVAEPAEEETPVPVAATQPEPVIEPEPEREPAPTIASYAEAERARLLREREERSAIVEVGRPEPEPESDAAPSWWSPEPAPERPVYERAVVEPEPAPMSTPEPEFTPEPQPAPEPQSAPEPVASTTESWWPEHGAEQSATAQQDDDAWALPEVERPLEDTGGDFAFPPSRPAPIGGSVPEPDNSPETDLAPAPPPIEEHADWPHDRGAYQAPPEPDDEDDLQHEPETLFTLDESEREDTPRPNP